MTWSCWFCGADVPDDRGRCPECQQYGSHTYNGIADRIGKAARRGDTDAVVAWSIVFREKLVDDLRELVQGIIGEGRNP